MNNVKPFSVTYAKVGLLENEMGGMGTETRIILNSSTKLCLQTIINRKVNMVAICKGAIYSLQKIESKMIHLKHIMHSFSIEN